VAVIGKLSVLRVAKISKSGKYGDGGGLYLQVTRNLVKSWAFRYKKDGVSHLMGLGPICALSLLEAREEARKIRALLVKGIDPLEARRDVIVKKQALAVRNKAAAVRNKKFDECVIEYIEIHKDAWRNEKHKKQWEATLKTYASPHFGKMYVRQIDTPFILKALKPIWATKTETATRLRERIERVLAWATTSGYRKGDNPARWNGHLEELLPKPSKVKNFQHHPAMPYMEVGAFYRLLMAQKGLAARALELTILTACRTSEVLNAKWEEIDFAQRIWVIPSERMKSGRVHRIPLGDAMLKVLQPLIGVDSVWVFPGAKEGKALSNMAMSLVLRRMGRADVTVHGFRSTFRDWVAEKTSYPREMAELALAHSVGSAVEEAYFRSDLFDRRRALMQDWATWCGESPTSAPEA
jgi:integrase